MAACAQATARRYYERKKAVAAVAPEGAHPLREDDVTPMTPQQVAWVRAQRR